MADPTKSHVSPVTPTWTDVAGNAASAPGVTWQNINTGGIIHLAFTASAPTGADGIITLHPGEAYYDVNGSAHVWARGQSGSSVSAVAD